MHNISNVRQIEIHVAEPLVSVTPNNIFSVKEKWLDKAQDVLCNV
jgi:hypothetical protein